MPRPAGPGISRSALRCGLEWAPRLLGTRLSKVLFPTAAVRPPRITKVHPNYLCNHDSRRTPHLLLAPPAVRNRAKALRCAPSRGCLRLGRYELREKLEGRSPSISTVSLENLSFTANRFLCTRPVRSRRYAYTSVPDSNWRGVPRKGLRVALFRPRPSNPLISTGYGDFQEIPAYLGAPFLTWSACGSR